MAGEISWNLATVTLLAWTDRYGKVFTKQVYSNTDGNLISVCRRCHYIIISGMGFRSICRLLLNNACRLFWIMPSHQLDFNSKLFIEILFPAYMVFLFCSYQVCYIELFSPYLFLSSISKNIEYIRLLTKLLCCYISLADHCGDGALDSSIMVKKMEKD